MTEIPEHLLKRSRERRAAMGGEGAEGDAPAEASSAPAPAAASPAPARAAAAPAEPAPPRVEAPRPVPAYVAAAQNRRKVPLWVSPVLALLPVWLFMYVNAMTRQPPEVTGPLAEGAAVYRSGCASCHAGNGSGGVGYPLYNGESIKSFPNIADQIRFIYNGNRPYAGKAYTPADREGGPHIAGVRRQPGTMPAWSAQLTNAEILAVVCHERFGLAPAEVQTTYQAEFDTWCSADAPNWIAVEEGGFEELGLDVSADVSIPSPPAAATAAGEAAG